MTANAAMQTDRASADGKGRYATVNGVDLYYEIHGAGEPLIMLAGGFGGVDMFGALVPALAESRQVIGVELQGHGHTPDVADRPLRFETMADDVAALIPHLGLDRADVLGYSLGGGVALRMAIQHPDVVRRLVLVSAPCKRDGWYAEDLAGMAAVNGEAAKTWVGSPMHTAYASVAPRPEDWPALADKLSALLRQEYDWSAEVRTMTIPTLLVIGDADGVRPAHAVEFLGLLGGAKAHGIMDPMPRSQLAIVPGTSHYNIVMRLEMLLPALTPFLDAAPPVAGLIPEA
jgi:pimeloyl-ACP methyl ester carboxylesterase